MLLFSAPLLKLLVIAVLAIISLMSHPQHISFIISFQDIERKLKYKWRVWTKLLELHIKWLDSEYSFVYMLVTLQNCVPEMTQTKSWWLSEHNATVVSWCVISCLFYPTLGSIILRKMSTHYPHYLSTCIKTEYERLRWPWRTRPIKQH